MSDIQLEPGKTEKIPWKPILLIIVKLTSRVRPKEISPRMRPLALYVGLYGVVLRMSECFSGTYTAQKMKFSIKDFSRKCDQIRRKLQIWSHLLEKSLMKNSIFCTVVILPSGVRPPIFCVVISALKLESTESKNWKDLVKKYERTDAKLVKSE